MFLIKLLIGVLSIIVCVKISKNKANEIKNSYDFFESLILTCDTLSCEMSYSKRPLKCLSNLNYQSYDYFNFISNFINYEKINYPCYLTDGEILKIKAFMNLLGKSDSISQKELICSFREEFAKISQEKRLKYQKTYGLTLKVGFSVGVMLFIMVI